MSELVELLFHLDVCVQMLSFSPDISKGFELSILVSVTSLLGSFSLKDNVEQGFSVMHIS